MEIQPGSTTLQMISAGLSGANPLLAPGILGITAVLAMAATYAHPALNPGEMSQSVDLTQDKNEKSQIRQTVNG